MTKFILALLLILPVFSQVHATGTDPENDEIELFRQACVLKGFESATGKTEEGSTSYWLPDEPIGGVTIVPINGTTVVIYCARPIVKQGPNIDPIQPTYDDLVLETDPLEGMSQENPQHAPFLEDPYQPNFDPYQTYEDQHPVYQNPFPPMNEPVFAPNFGPSFGPAPRFP